MNFVEIGENVHCVLNHFQWAQSSDAEQASSSPRNTARPLRSSGNKNTKKTVQAGCCWEAKSNLSCSFLGWSALLR